MTERMQRILAIFAPLALVGGPIIALIGVLALAGVVSFGTTGMRTADAGERLQVSAVTAPQTLWVTPANVDLAAARCVTADGDSYPLTSGEVVERGPEQWLQVAVVESVMTRVSCDGGGIERFAVADLASANDTKGGPFFVFAGLFVAGAGLVARALRRRGRGPGGGPGALGSARGSY